jgi:N utilization substance protein B
MNDTPSHDDAPKAEKPAPKGVPLSLRRKSSARLAAVQCLYRLKITLEETLPEDLLTDYMEQWKDDKQLRPRVISIDADPDTAFLRKLLTGAMEHKDMIDGIITGSLNDKWTAERMSPLLLSILTCAIYELKFSAARPPVVIDEYVTLTGRFFENAEIGFVNGLLDTLGRTLREE